MAELDGLVVLDCSLGDAGPRASGILADYGAQVIWIEPPGGDPARSLNPPAAAVFNRGKKSVVLDLANGEDRETVRRLAERADVFIESWSPGVADAMGLGAADLQARNPQLVYCAISGSGAHDRTPGPVLHEPLAHALWGTMAVQAGHREGPIFQALPLASMGAAHLTVIGALAALYRRFGDGVGRVVETSLADGLLAFHSMQWGESDASIAAAGNPQPNSSVMLRPSEIRMVTRSFLCSDDTYVGVHTLARGGFDRFMEVLGLSAEIPPTGSGSDSGVPLAPEQAALLEANIHRIFAQHPRDYWVKRLLEADLCAIEHLAPTVAFDDPQVQHNGMVVTAEDAVLGPVEMVAPNLRFDGKPPRMNGAAPTVGADTEAVLQGLSRPPSTSPWRATPPNPDGPDRRPLLDGVKVVDLSAFYAGPYASRLLADLGADVIKVEPLAGDQMRGLERSFFSGQAGKRAMAANLKDADLAPVRRRLIEWADIVHHNMRPGAAEKIGFGVEHVRAVNPDAVYLFSPGWGASGPHCRRQSFAPMLLNYVGASFEVAGQFNEPLPPVGNEDSVNGLAGAVALLLGLVTRRLTGKGSYCESPLLNAAMSMVRHIVRSTDGEVIGGERLDVLQMGTGALESLYQTPDGWLCLAVRSPAEIEDLEGRMGLHILDDPRFATVEARVRHRDELTEMLRAAFDQRSTAAWLEAFRGSRVGLVQPADMDFVHAFLNDPEQQRLGRVAEAVHPQKGAVREIDKLVRVSDAQVVPHRLAPALGAHTDDVLAMLGFEPDYVAGLRAGGKVR